MRWSVAIFILHIDIIFKEINHLEDKVGFVIKDGIVEKTVPSEHIFLGYDKKMLLMDFLEEVNPFMVHYFDKDGKLIKFLVVLL